MSEQPLRVTLRLRDLVLSQVLIVVGLNWFGPAAQLGSLQWVYWLLGILCFHLPLAAVVIHLSRKMPVEGGLYQWAKSAFSERAGFLVAWNFWVFVILFSSTFGLSVMTAIGYATGAGEAWMANRAWQIGISALVTATLVGLASAGFGTAKWVHNLASAGLLSAAAILIALPFISPHTAVNTGARSTLSMMQVVLFTRIAVYALAGFECMSMVIGECRDGARTIPRSIAIAVPCIAAIYIFGTRSVLAFIPAHQVDLVNPLAQTFSTALGRTAATAAILLVVLRDFGMSSQAFSVATRLPLVAGWDHLLPRWFTRVNKRTGTPTHSILFAGAVMLVSSLAAIVASGRQEAFQILLSTGGVFFATTYLVLFAIPILGRGTPWWLRLAASSGLIVTAAFVILSFVPIVDVVSKARYAMAIGAAVVASNSLALVTFSKGKRVSVDGSV